MGTLKVILKQDIPNLGEEGDVKAVKRGYARNFLFPRNLVTDYSKQNIKVLDSRKNLLEKKKSLKVENAGVLKEKLEKEKISITVSAGEKGRLFGTITSLNIIEKLKELGYTTIDKKSIELKEHIKFDGKYKFRIHLYQDVYANMELEVIGKLEKPKANPKEFKKFKKRSESHYNKDDKKTESAEADQQKDEKVENNEIISDEKTVEKKEKVKKEKVSNKKKEE